jgi:CubicO group peptidase (beta-lactamase class C family)
MLRYSACALIFTLPLGALADDSAALQRIEKAIEKARKATFVPGASLAIVQGDKIVFAKGFGLRDVSKKLPATPNTLYCIGSSTKAFTGLLVAESAREGKLSLTDPPSKYIPEFRLKDPEANKSIQIEDMLTHRSGLPRTDLAWYSGKFDRNDIIQMLPEFEPTAKLRQKWQYQNVMFMLAGEIAGRVNSTTYDALLREKIFNPLGMSRTNSTYTEWTTAEETAQGYSPAGPGTAQNPVPYRRIDAAGPAGGINSNVLEMAQWVRLQLGKGSLGGKTVFAPETIEDTWKSRIEMIPGSGAGYGFGWMVKKWQGQRLIEHGGNIDGYNAEVAFLPESNVGFVMLTNVSASPLTSQAINIVFSELAGKKEEPAKATSAQPSSTPSAFKPAVESDMGSYDLDIAKTTLSFKLDKGQVILEQSGVKLPLKLVGDKTYEPAIAGAPKFKLTFAPTPADPKQTEVRLEQNGMNFTLPKQPPYSAPMTGEQLLAKMVEAQGGESAILKQRHMVSRYTARIASDGITVRGTDYMKDGNKDAKFAVFFALNRRFAWNHEFTDGNVAYDLVSFAITDKKSGAELHNSLNAANIEMDLHPKENYKSLRIIKEDKVNGEDVYVLEKKPKAGSVSTEYVSKTSYLVLKRQAGPSTVTFSDFRDTEGLHIPYRQVVDSPENGQTIVTIDSVSFTEPIPSWVFRYIPVKN